MKLSPHPWWHPLFEILGYGVGYVIYRRAQIQSGDTSQVDQGWPVLAAAAIGALIGSRVLGLLEQAPRLHLTWSRVLLPGGRTTVGGLLGGWVAVELFRSLHGVDAHLGDLYPVPLCLGIAIGRIGCLVAGLPDGTQGFPTDLPWGIDFGDGIPRHPTPLYETLFLLALAYTLYRYNRAAHPAGATLRIFMVVYLAWRLLIDFLKPQPLIHGLNLIQWTCIAGLLALLPGLMRLLPIYPCAIRSNE